MEWLNSLINGLRSGDLSEVSPQLMERIGNGLVGLALLVGAYFAAKICSRYISSTICRRVDETLGKFLGRLSFYTILIASSLGILAKFGISVAGAMAVLTAAGFAIGLAFQGTLSNFASGVLLLVFRPFKVGDMVIAGGVTGKINEIDLFTTTFDTPDNRRLIVPNSAISGGTIENMTYHAHRRVDITVGVAYAASLDATRAALTQAVMNVSDLMIPGENRGYQVLLGQLGASSVDWTIRFWAATDNVFKARERLTMEVKTQLMKAEIDIPFPQMQLHISQKDLPEKHLQELAPQTEYPSAISPVRPRMRRSGEAA
jgi:small conductance mechanosensitive channel